MTQNKRNIIANYLGVGWSALMSVAFIPLYIRYLGIEAYGLIGIFTTLQTCMALLDAGITPTLSRELALSQAGARTPQATRDLSFTAEILYFVIVTVVIAVLFLTAPAIATRWIRATQLPIPLVIQALQVMGVVLGMRWLTSLYRGAFVGLQRQVWLNWCTSAFATLRGFGAVGVLALISPTISTFFVYQAIVAALEAMVLGIQLRKVLPKAPNRARFSIERLLQVWRFAAGMTLVTLLGIILTQFDKLLLSKLLPLSSFGYYMIASSVTGALYILVSPIANASYPQFTVYVARGDEVALAEAYHKFAQITAVAVVPASLILALFARHILFLWTHDAVIANGAAPLVSVLALGNMLHGLMHTSYTLQLAYGWTRFNIAINAVAVLLLLPAIYVAVRMSGAIGAAVVWVVLNVGYVLIATPLMHRKLLPLEMWRWYRQDVFFPFATTLLSVGIVYLLVRSKAYEGAAANILLLILVTGIAFLSSAVATPLGRKEIGVILQKGRALLR